MKTLTPLCFLLLASTASANLRTSARYSITTETTAHAGQRTTSARYTNDGTASALGGQATSAAYSNRAAFPGQLTDPTALQLTAPAASLAEASTLQLTARLVLDDATFLVLPATSVAWSSNVAALSLNANGLATAAAVISHTAATASGTHLTFSANLPLTVLDTLPDNFGSYAGDGLPDAWQNQFFGLANPLAGPLLDPDFDGQNNRLEFLGGVTPNDPNSRVVLTGQLTSPTTYQVQLAPARPGTTTQSTLTPGTIAPLSVSLSATGARNFYRVLLEPAP
jgi:hypothetical protein